MAERTISVSITGNSADFQAALEAAGLQAKVVADQITDAFGTTFKAKMDAAFKSLPDLKIDADSSDVDTKLAAIKGEMDDLRNANIGVDLSDTDALAKVDDLTVRLKELGAESPDIRVKVDAADAIAKLDLIKKAADDASGRDDTKEGISGLTDALDKVPSDGGPGLSSLSGVMEGLPDLISPTTLVTGELATALIPLGAAAIGAGIGLAGMVTAAGAAVGAFGIAAMPVFSQVSGAITTITSDQAAMNSAMTDSEKTDAYLRMQSDLAGLSPMVRQVADAVIQAKQAFTDWDAQFDPAILTVFNSALADFEPLLNDITPLVYAGAAAISDFFHQVGDVANSSDFKNFIAFLAAQAGPAIQAITKVAENFGKAFADALQKSGPLITDVENGLVGISGALTHWVDDGGFQSFLNWIEKNGPGIVKDVEDIATALGRFIPALAPVGLAVLNFIGDIAGLTNKIKGFANDIVSFVVDPMGKIQGAVQNAAASFGTLASKVLSVFSSAGTWLINAGRNIIGGLWSGVQEAWAKPVAFFSNLGSVVIGFLANAASWLVGSGEAILKGLWTGIMDSYHLATDWITTLGSSIGGFFSGAPNWLIGAGEAILRGLWNGISDSLHLATDWIGQLGGSIGGLFAGASNWLVGAGEAIVRGLADGITDGAGLVESAVSHLASLIPQWAKDILKIASPSLVFYQEIGLPIVQGLAEGITDNVQLARQAATFASTSTVAAGVAASAASSQSLPPIGTSGSAFSPSGSNSSGDLHVEFYLDKAQFATAVVPNIRTVLYQNKRAVGTLQMA